MGEQQPVAGEQPRPALLRLNQQQFVERILVGERDEKWRGGGFRVEGKDIQPDPSQRSQNRRWIGWAFADSRPVEAVPIEAQLPDGNRRDEKLMIYCCKDSHFMAG